MSRDRPEDWHPDHDQFSEHGRPICPRCRLELSNNGSSLYCAQCAEDRRERDSRVDRR